MISKHQHARGTIVLTDEGKDAHVCLGEREVDIGDQVEVFDAVCEKVVIGAGQSSRLETNCQKIHRGHAEVVEPSDEHYSKIKAINGLILRESQIVEKAKK